MKKEDFFPILEHLETLSETEKKMLRYVRMAYRSHAKAKQEPVEALQNQYFNLSQTQREIAELQLLEDLLHSFLTKKGFKHSLLQGEELIGLIYQEKKQLQEKKEVVNEAIEDIQKLLN